MAPVCPETVQLFQLPKEKTLLWDHTGCGRPYTLHMVAHQKPKVFIKEKILQLALKHLGTRDDGRAFCYFIGSMTTNGPSSVGFSVVLNKFSDDQCSLASCDDEFIVPVVLCQKTKGDYQWDMQQYLSDLKAIADSTVNMPSLDISQFLKFRIHCSYYGIQCDTKIEMATVATAFTATPICAVPMLRTELSEYLSKSEDFVPHSGFLVMDSEKRLIIIPETEQKLSVLPLIGIWVSGISSILHPVVWSACVRYISCGMYKRRLCLPPLPFLLALYHPEVQQPTFFNCICEGENAWPVFSSFEGQASADLPKIPVMNSKMLAVDLLPLNIKCKELEEASRQVEKRNLPKSPPVITSNAIDAPQPSHKAPKVFEINIDPKPQVPDLSFDTGTVATRPPMPLPYQESQPRNYLYPQTSPSYTNPFLPNYNIPQTVIPYATGINNNMHPNQNTSTPMNQISSFLHQNGVNFNSNMLGNCGFKAIANISNSNQVPKSALECFGLSGNIINENQIANFVSPYENRTSNSPCMIQAHASVLKKMPSVQHQYMKPKEYNWSQDNYPIVPYKQNSSECRFLDENDRDDLPKQKPTLNQCVGHIIKLCNDQSPNTVPAIQNVATPTIQNNAVPSTTKSLQNLAITETKPFPKSCLKKTSSFTQVPHTNTEHSNKVIVSSCDNSKKKPVVKSKSAEITKGTTQLEKRPTKKFPLKTNTHIPVKVNSNLLTKSKASANNENLIEIIQTQNDVLNNFQNKIFQLLNQQSNEKLTSKTVKKPERPKINVPLPKKKKDVRPSSSQKVPENKAIDQKDVMVTLQEQREKLTTLENQIKALMASKENKSTPKNKVSNTSPAQSPKTAEHPIQKPPEQNVQISKISCTAATMTSFVSATTPSRSGHNSRYLSHKAAMFAGTQKFAHSTSYQHHNCKQPEEETGTFEVDLNTDTCYSMCLEQQINIDDDEPHSPERPVVIDLPEHPNAIFYSESSDLTTCGPTGHNYKPTSETEKTIYRCVLGQINSAKSDGDRSLSFEESGLPNYDTRRQYPQKNQVLQHRNFFASNDREMQHVDSRHLQSNGPKHISIVHQSCIITKNNSSDHYNHPQNFRNYSAPFNEDTEARFNWNQKQHRQAHCSDFTNYGLTDPSMSFATRCYLENYRLKMGSHETVINEYEGSDQGRYAQDDVHRF